MTLPVSGLITMSQVNTELGRAATAQISLGESAVRSLAGVPSGAISMSQLHGKSVSLRLVAGTTPLGDVGYEQWSATGSLTPSSPPSVGGSLIMTCVDFNYFSNGLRVIVQGNHTGKQIYARKVGGPTFTPPVFTYYSGNNSSEWTYNPGAAAFIGLTSGQSYDMQISFSPF